MAAENCFKVSSTVSVTDEPKRHFQLAVNQTSFVRLEAASFEAFTFNVVLVVVTGIDIITEVASIDLCRHQLVPSYSAVAKITSYSLKDLLDSFVVLAVVVHTNTTR